MSAKRILVAFFGIMIMGTGSLRAAEARAEPKISVEVIGVQVVMKGYGYDKKWDRYDKLPFNTQALGIEVALALSYPAGGIIEMDKKQSELVAFKDDHKTDLKAKVEGARFGNEPGFGSFPKIINDGKGLLFSVKSPILPASGTRMVGVSGRLALLTGSTQKTVEAKNIDLNVGTKFKLGDYDFEISKVGKPDWGDEPMAVTFKLSKELAGVIEFSFHAGDGTKLESGDAGSSTMSFGSMVQVEKSFKFKKKITNPVKISMTYWADLKQVKVPFRVKTSLMP